MRPEKEIRAELARCQKEKQLAVSRGSIPDVARLTTRIQALQFCLGNAVVGVKPQSIKVGQGKQ